MTTAELPATHQTGLPVGRIKKLTRTLSSIDMQLRSRRDVIQQQQNVIYALLKSRDRLANELHGAANEPPSPSQRSPDTHLVKQGIDG